MTPNKKLTHVARIAPSPMSGLNILIACEFTGTTRRAFEKKGHNAYSCDLVETEDFNLEGKHLIGDARKFVSKDWMNSKHGIKWDLLIAHPPCTYLTVTANKWLKDQPPRKSGALVGAERRAAVNEAALLFMHFAAAEIEKICIENPVGVMSSLWRKPDQIITPCQFGHKEPKKTCLWLKGLEPLTHTKLVEPEYYTTKSGKRLAKWYYKDATKGTAEERQKIRNRTFSGIAEAMAHQWGSFLT